MGEVAAATEDLQNQPEELPAHEHAALLVHQDSLAHAVQQVLVVLQRWVFLAHQRLDVLACQVLVDASRRRRRVRRQEAHEGLQ